MICKLADDTEKKTDGTEVIHPIFCEKFVTSGMSVEFPKLHWILYID